MSLRFKKLLSSPLCLILTAFLLIPIGTKAYAQDSYIIVHALNPENIEIASIQGMSQNSVEIYDGDILIGYGAYNVATHNKPIILSSGNHTIKAKFNGIELVQAINVDPFSTTSLTFVFPRTTFNLEDLVSSANQRNQSWDISFTTLNLELVEQTTGVWKWLGNTAMDKSVWYIPSWHPNSHQEFTNNTVNASAEGNCTVTFNVTLSNLTAQMSPQRVSYTLLLDPPVNPNWLYSVYYRLFIWRGNNQL